ncbi:MAG: hypothetical protein K0R08_687 [Solimicrobium sp.]|jgi:hypothetical protein|nr:hypothetical protein [Solimicrobium sp.]
MTSKLSRYFTNLTSSYNAELDDLRTDSEGKNVLKARLAQKREQIPQLLMMLEFSPEMVAVAFHGAFFFKNSLAIESLITKEASKFPSWATLQKAIVIEPWAEKLVNTILEDPNGETFLITTVGLEYLNRCSQSRSAHPTSGQQDDQQNEWDDEGSATDNDDSDASLNSDEQATEEGESTEYDLEKAGADWLAEQGFDRKE